MNSELSFNSDHLVGDSQKKESKECAGDVRWSHLSVTTVTTLALVSRLHLTCQSAGRRNTHG